VTAIAGKGPTAVVKVRSTRMLLAIGFLRTIFEVVRAARTSVDVVSTSEVSVSLTVDQMDRLDAVLIDLATLGDVAVERGAWGRGHRRRRDQRRRRRDGARARRTPGDQGAHAVTERPRGST